MKLSDRNVLIDPCNNIENNNNHQGFLKNHVRSGLTTLLIGLIALIIGLRPDLFGLDRGLYIGFSQIILILFGIGCSLWVPPTLCAPLGLSGENLLVDIGTRTIMTGYVICVFTASADAFGLAPILPRSLAGHTPEPWCHHRNGRHLCWIVMMLRFQIPQTMTR